MDIIEILERPSPAVYSEEEMIFAIKEYIKQCKNVDVDINLYKGVDVNNPFARVQLSQEYMMLNSAFEHVQLNYNKNDIKN